ncbi:MAG: DEAD/DEAH box helicase [Gemmataceae bacterium]|nr:DEAD/DEAH box helicase [Gemmataceae bacterium]
MDDMESHNPNVAPSPESEDRLSVGVITLSKFERPMEVKVREAKLLNEPPWTRALGKLPMDVSTFGWKFPTPIDQAQAASKPRLLPPEADAGAEKPVVSEETAARQQSTAKTWLRPPSDAVMFKDRLLYLLQPPLEELFSGKQVQLPFQPYPYQLKGIAFLMPRHAALIADEMGLGKTAQVIIALRLLLHAGLIGNALIVCPKPLVINWTRELRLWAEDVPFEVITGDAKTRRFLWQQSRCPVKLVNYEVLSRDAALATHESVRFDVVAIDEAQRIKNRESRTAQVVCSLNRTRSWAMSGTPIENRVEDLVNIFEFVDKQRIPPGAPTKQLPQLTSDCIIRRTKDEVATDMPPKVIRDSYLELTPAQRAAYDTAEKEGIIHLNQMGDTITVQHVFELVMRLKQICNFDPATRESAKLEQMQADLAEVAESGRKAIIFSQWVEPLEVLAEALAPYGPLQYHGKIPHKERQAILDQFKTDPSKHVILMSYGTGSVGLNLQFTNYVFLFDRWWNPAIEDQAINRAHRLGQKTTVFVTRFITPGTIEGRIHDVLEKKRELFNELIGQSGTPSLGLSESEIFSLFDIQSRPKRAAA